LKVRSKPTLKVRDKYNWGGWRNLIGGDRGSDLARMEKSNRGG